MYLNNLNRYDYLLKERKLVRNLNLFNCISQCLISFLLEIKNIVIILPCIKTSSNSWFSVKASSHWISNSVNSFNV